MLHIIVIACILIGLPVLSVAGATSKAFWLFLESRGSLAFVEFTERWELGWIVIVAVITITFQLLMYRVVFADDIWRHIKNDVIIFDKIPILITLIGVLLFILNKAVGLDIPEILRKMHLVFAGISSFIICLILKLKVWGFLTNEERVD